MAGMNRARPESQESALKYFVTGAFASAFFLYGIALLYGVSGSTSLDRVARAVARAAPGAVPLAVLGAALLLVGFGFKVASVPFHMWAPDVYEGAPTTVTAFMSAGVKAAAFGALLRVFDSALPALASHWQPLVAVLAIVTMVVGNLARARPDEPQAHAGVLVDRARGLPADGARRRPRARGRGHALLPRGLRRGEPRAPSARSPRSRATAGSRSRRADLAGLAERRPALAAALTVFLVSLTGIPVTAGFVGKFYLFNAAVAAGWVVLALVGVIMSVVSAYYYLRVVVAMYMRDPVGEDDWSPVSPAAALRARVLGRGHAAARRLAGAAPRRSPASPPAA